MKKLVLPFLVLAIVCAAKHPSNAQVTLSLGPKEDPTLQLRHLIQSPSF